MAESDSVPVATSPGTVTRSAGMASLVGAPRHCRPPLRTHVAADRRTLRPLELTRPSDELVVYPTLDAASAGR